MHRPGEPPASGDPPQASIWGEFFAGVDLGRPTQMTRHLVVIAESEVLARDYCREHGINPSDPMVIIVRACDTWAVRYLRGVVDLNVVRVRNVRAAPAVEEFLSRCGQHDTGSVGELLHHSNEATRDMLRTTLRFLAGIAYAAPSAAQEAQDVPALDDYRPHPEWLDTTPESPTRWKNPHHWSSTFQRSPYWRGDEQVLQVPTEGLTDLVYRLDELEEDVRYV